MWTRFNAYLLALAVLSTAVAASFKPGNVACSKLRRLLISVKR